MKRIFGVFFTISDFNVILIHIHYLFWNVKFVISVTEGRDSPNVSNLLPSDKEHIFGN